MQPNLPSVCLEGAFHPLVQMSGQFQCIDVLCERWTVSLYNCESGFLLSPGH